MWLIKRIDAKTARIENDVRCKYMVALWHPLLQSNNMKLEKILYLTKITVEDCPPYCKCNLMGFPYENNLPTCEVDCSRQNLTSPPEVIPRIASFVNFSGNHFTDFSSIFQNEHYDSVSTLYLNNNHIVSFDGKSFYDYFMSHNRSMRIFLRNNNMTSFPVNWVSQALKEADKEHHFQLSIGNNSWPCDKCSFITDFQKMLQKYPSNFVLEDIKCKDPVIVDGFIMHEYAFGVEVEKVCESSRIHPLDLACAILTFLIIIVIGLIYYMYTLYKRHNKLPFM